MNFQELKAIDIGKRLKVRLPMWRYEPTYYFTEKRRDVLIDFDAIVTGFVENKIVVTVPHGYTYLIDYIDIIS